MRIWITVSEPADGSRDVEIEVDGESGPALASHKMDARPEAVAEVAAVMNRFEQNKSAAGDVKAIGHQLFDHLLGTAAWDAILAAADRRGTRSIELALAWPAGEHALNRLPWEAMHDGTHFICGHQRLCVAVTRIVTDADQTLCAAPVPAPVRVLFVLGCDLSNRDIRNGTEVLGLLRDAERGAGAIDPLVVDNASLDRLTAACARFQPQIVHIVSHGTLKTGGSGIVRLKADDGHNGEATAEDLLGAFAAADELPRLAVLTGCDTAASGEHMDSLAAALVKGGVPKAIGMAGRISDRVSRLFARRFGAALNAGECLVEAMAHGRRAGLRSQADAAADEPAWAMPSIYLAPSVPSDHAPVDAGAQTAVFERIDRYDLRQDPVFCGRQSFLRLFDRLLDPNDQLQVAIGYADDQHGLGKTRLLHEFARQALRGGNVVVMIDDDGNTPQLPKTQVALAAKLAREITETRRRFELAIPEQSMLIAELAAIFDKQCSFVGAASDDARAARVFGFLGALPVKSKGFAIDDDALRIALTADLAALAADARSSADESVGEGSQAVVILGGIGEWGEAASTLLDVLLQPSGLGTTNDPVPVFAVGSHAEIGTLLRGSKVEGKSWARTLRLAPFKQDEATLAYQTVLLHPRATAEEDEIIPFSNLVYTPTRGHEATWHEKFSAYIGGVPAKLSTDTFYAIASSLSDGPTLVADNDVAALASYADELAAEQGS